MTQDERICRLCDLLEEIIQVANDKGIWRSSDYFIEELHKIRDNND